MRVAWSAAGAAARQRCFSPRARALVARRERVFTIIPKRDPETPWVFYGLAAYCASGLAISTYYLVTIDAEAEQSCARLRAGDAFGEDPFFQGLEDLCMWVEWSSVTVGVDVRPKLVVKHGAQRALVHALTSRDDEARAMAFGAVAGLSQVDALAKKFVQEDPAIFAALVHELESLSDEHLTDQRTSDIWARLYTREVGALVAVANLALFYTQDDAQEDGNLLERAVRSTMFLVRVVREAQYALDDAEEGNGGVTEISSSTSAGRRAASWVLSLQDSVLRDMLIEVETSALQVAAHAAVHRRGALELSRIEGALDLLVDRALASEDADAALHANLALSSTLKRYPDAAAAIPDTPLPAAASALFNPRRILMVERSFDAFAVVPLLGAAAWGAARRWYDSQTSGEAFGARSPKFSLPRSMALASGRAALGSAVLTALYGNRGARYELRRELYAESDAGQFALSAAVLAADLAIVRTILRVAPYSITPFVLISILT